MKLDLKFKNASPDFKLSFSPVDDFSLKFKEDLSTFHVDFGEFSPITFIYSEWYEGPYVIDPQPDSVTLNIQNLTARRNITINPYPKAYAFVEDKLLTIIGNFPIEVLEEPAL